MPYRLAGDIIRPVSGCFSFRGRECVLCAKEAIDLFPIGFYPAYYEPLPSPIYQPQYAVPFAYRPHAIVGVHPGYGGGYEGINFVHANPQFTI